MVLKGWMPTTGTPIQEACFGCVRREVPLVHVLVDPLLVFALVLQAQVEVTARATCSDGDEGWGRVLASNDRGRESHREEHLTTDRTDRESSSMVAGGTENSVAAMVLRRRQSQKAKRAIGNAKSRKAGRRRLSTHSTTQKFSPPFALVFACWRSGVSLFRAVISIVQP